MDSTLERRNERSERVPLQIEVELGQGDFADAFAADSLNLSKGGISMRAPCLPDVGSRLLCRFECMGTLITAQGEVVWAHLDAERCGEFGLAFVGLDPQSEWLIEEMIAERAARSPRQPPADVAAEVATLELESSESAMPTPVADAIADADGGKAVFEQHLDLLRLGRGVRTRALGADGRVGSIAAVELRMVGNVPMLAVTVEFSGEAQPATSAAAHEEPVGLPESLLAAAAFASTTLESEPAPAVPAGAARESEAGSPLMQPLAHDTEPDLAAPFAVDSAASADELQPSERSQHKTLSEFEAEPAHVAEDAAALAPAEQAEVAPEAQEAEELAAEAPAAPVAASSSPSWPPSPGASRQRASSPSSSGAPVQRASLPPSYTTPSQRASSLHAQQRASMSPARVPSPLPRPRMPLGYGAATAQRVAAAEPTRAPRPAPLQLELPDDEGLEFEHELADDPDFSRSFKLPKDDDAYFELEESEIAQWKPAALDSLRALAGTLAALLGSLRAQLQDVWNRMLPELRGALLRGSAWLRGQYAGRIGPQLGAARRFLSMRRRRTTGPGQARSRSGLGRTFLLGVLGAGATALAVYALAPGGSEEIELHRTIRPSDGAAAEPAAPAAIDVGTPEPGTLTATAAVAAGARPTGKPAAPDPRTEPSAKQVPAGSPFAVDVREGGAAAKAAAGPALRFGAAQVPRARRFTLRMSGRVRGLQGVADPGGFNVTVLGALSLDRAGPISSAHKAVQRAMIINKGDRAELNIRFADGKRPAYQVTAEGNALHVLLQDG